MERRLTYQEVANLYNSDIKSKVLFVIEACLQTSDNPHNRYGLMQCVVINAIRDLATASRAIYDPNETEADFVRRLFQDLIKSYEQEERNQRILDGLKSSIKSY
jgi:hypothetical protein